MHLPAPPTAGATSNYTCLNCGLSHHFVQECTAPKNNATQGHVTHPPCGPQRVVVAKICRVNYTTMEDIPEGEQVIMGTFSLNGYPVVILFDSGATYDFISKACIQKCQLAIQDMSTPYLIKTPSGKISTNQLVKNTPLNLGGKEYKTCLIVLEGQGIDIILGMGWMKAHKALPFELYIWTPPFMAFMFSNCHPPLLQTLQFTILPLRAYRTFLWPPNFLMSFQKICRVCPQTGMYSSLLNYSLVLHLSPDGQTR
jgi:hypothetical protein